MHAGAPRIHVGFDFLQPKPTHFSPLRVEYDLIRLDIPIPCAKVRAAKREIKTFLRLAKLVLRSLDIGNVASHRTHTQHPPGSGIPNHKVLIGHRDRFLGLPMPEVRFTLPVTVLEHGSEDDIGNESALIRMVIIGYRRVFDRIIRRETNHSAACWIEINSLPAWVCNANKV